MIPLRPSNAFGWTRCAAKPSFEAREPEEIQSDAAREGSCAAWVADAVLKGGNGVKTAADMMLGKTHENGWLVTADMVEHVQGYIYMILARGGVTRTEQFVRLTDLIAGTFDASTSLEDATTLHVDDLKYGFQIVDVYENYQLLIYAGAEWLRLNDQRIRTIILGIYQPRAFHPDGIYRTWTITVEKLFEYLEWIVSRSILTQGPTPTATPGPQCDYCLAAASCVALAHSTYRDNAVIEDVRQKHMSAVELAKELSFLKDAERRLSARISAVQTEGTERLKKGEFVPGWYLKQRLGNRKFTVEPFVIRILTGVDPSKPGVVTPAELERNGASPAVVKDISIRPIIGYELDRMPANLIEKAFSK